MGKFEKTLKEKFGINVAGLAAWTDNTLPNIESDLIANSLLPNFRYIESFCSEGSNFITRRKKSKKKTDK